MQPLFRIFCSFVFFFCVSRNLKLRMVTIRVNLKECWRREDLCRTQRWSILEYIFLASYRDLTSNPFICKKKIEINRYAVWLWPGWLKNPKNIQLTAPRTAAIPLQFKHDSQHRRTQIAVISHHMMWCTKHRDVSQTPLSKHISYVVMLLYTKGIWLKSLSAAPESVPHPHFPASTKEQEQRIIDIRLLFHNDH